MMGNVIQHVGSFFAVCAEWWAPLMDLDTSTLVHFASKALFHFWYTALEQTSTGALMTLSSFACGPLVQSLNWHLQ